MLKVGIVGMGVIGRRVAEAVDARHSRHRRWWASSVRDAGHRRRLPALLPLDELIERADLIVEAATQAALREFGPAVLAAGKHLMVLSVGALVGVLDDWARAGREARLPHPGARRAPSPGLDGVKGAREGAITAVTMETRKPPRGLAGAPCIEQQRIDLDAITERDADLRGPGHRRRSRRSRPTSTWWPRCRWPASGPSAPGSRSSRCPARRATSTASRSRASSARLRIEVENVPSENPRTGRLSYLSAIAMLRELGAPVHVGN